MARMRDFKNGIKGQVEQAQRDLETAELLLRELDEKQAKERLHKVADVSAASAKLGALQAVYDQLGGDKARKPSKPKPKTPVADLPDPAGPPRVAP